MYSCGWSTCILGFLARISSYSQEMVISFKMVNRVTFEANDSAALSLHGYEVLLKFTARILLAKLVARVYYVSSDIRWSVLFCKMYRFAITHFPMG